PDGAHLAFERSTGGDAGEIWLIPARGGSPARLTNDAPSVFSKEPAFTVDGLAVVHQSNRAGATNLWAIRLDGHSQVRLTTGPGPDEASSVARDGSITFANMRTRCGVIAQE